MYIPVIFSLSLYIIIVNLIDIVTKTAVPLDPVYTLKGVRGLLGELKNNPSSFSGTRILYIHTG